MDDAALAGVTDRLRALPGVVAVALGGSRATGEHRADSDWDLAVYYRDGFDPAHLRAIGWPGEVSEIGGWGGVFNGGAWLTIEGASVDVHYRDLARVEHEIAEARQGRFEVEPLLFHLAGIPTYLLLAELAIDRVLAGRLPRPEYPEPLRTTAPDRWWSTARATLGYARDGHARRGEVVLCHGLLATAVAQTAHAVLAARGRWVTNEKRLLAAAGLDLGHRFAAAGSGPDELVRLADDVRERCAAAVAAAVRDRDDAHGP